MKLGKQTAICMMTMVTMPAIAMVETDTLKVNSHYFHKELNHLKNLYDGTYNPIRLSKNEVKTVADAYVDVQFMNGDYHAIDRGKKSRAFKVNISGQKNFDRLDVYGHIDYTNGKEYAHKWNSTLFVTDTNSFVLGDDIESDVNTEVFSMSAAVSYKFNRCWTGALSLGYKTGSLSDQTDPRPKTNAMHFDINPGIEVKLNDTHALGLSALVDIFRSDLTHAIVNNNLNYTYYVMKGMGDHMVVTSNDMGNYPREYRGNKYNGALQWTVTPSLGNLSNILELSFTSNKEVSDDGGYAFTFKSGDYYRKDIGLYERLSLKSSSRFRQNIGLQATYTSDYGNWYDQKKMVDTEHGNLPYYKILNKSKISETTYVNARLTYQADWMKQHIPDLTVTAEVGLNNMDSKYYATKNYKQQVNMLLASAGVTKHFIAGKARLTGTAQLYYATPMGTPQYTSADKKIAATYTAPKFEYLASARLGFNLEAKAFLPVNIYHYTTLMGLKICANATFYQGDALFYDLMESTSRTVINAAFNVIF